MAIYQRLKPRSGKEIPFLILVSFLFSFFLSRLITYLSPEFYIPIRGNHVHHFAYGIILLALVGYLLLTQPRSFRARLSLSVFYGFALGLAFDEFFMWIELENKYPNFRQALDPIIYVTLILLNIIYFDNFWRRWGTRLGRLLYILVTYPLRLLRLTPKH